MIKPLTQLRTILQKHLRYSASCPPLNTQTNPPPSRVPSTRVSTAYFPFVTDKLLYMKLPFFPTHYLQFRAFNMSAAGVNSASDGNEYKENFVGVKAAGA
jgi:hypothetical protein